MLFAICYCRKRHRIESDTAPHSTASTPLDLSGVGSLATKKSREDRKLEEVIKLIEKMEEKETARKSSSQEDGVLYSPGLGISIYLTLFLIKVETE